MKKFSDKHPDAKCVQQYQQVSAPGMRKAIEELRKQLLENAERWDTFEVSLHTSQAAVPLTKKEVLDKWGNEEGEAYMRRIRELHQISPEAGYVTTDPVSGCEM